MTYSSEVRLGSLVLKNPVMTASGTFGYGAEYAQLLPINKLGGIVTKAVTVRPRPGNAAPRIWETPSGMLNSIGLANVGLERFLVEKMPFLRALDCAVVVNIAGATDDEYCRLAEGLSIDGIAALEVNISCPNVKDGGLSYGASCDATGRVVERIRACTDRHLMVKLSPNVTDIGEFARIAEQAGADSISAINTLVGMAVDVRTRKPRIPTITAGLSGPAIKPVGLACIWKIAKATRLPICAMGGIATWEDAVEYLLVGATAVQVGTINFVNPRAPIEVVEGIERYCREQGVASPMDLVGTLDVEGSGAIAASPW